MKMIGQIESILEVQNLGIDYKAFNTDDELTDWLDGRKLPGFDEPVRVSERQREALREVYNQK